MSTIYTFGYTGSKPEDLRQYVEALCAPVVDVRLSPVSRVAHWNGGRIEDLVGTARYTSIRDWGNVNYATGGPVRIRDFERGLVGFRRNHGTDSSLILLCACKGHEECHRSIVAGLLSDRLGWPVVHLPTRFAGYAPELPR